MSLILRRSNKIALSKGDKKKQVDGGEKIHQCKLEMKLTVNKTEISNISYSWISHTPFRLETRRLRVVKCSKKRLYTKEKKYTFLK